MRLSIAVALAACGAALAAQEFRVDALRRDETASLARLLDRTIRGWRNDDRAARWEGHFLKGPDGLTYVPFTLALDESAAFESAAVAIRVAERGLVSSRAGQYALRYVAQDAFGIETQRAPDGGRFFRSALALRPGRYELFVAVQDRAVRRGSPRSVVVTQSISVPDFTRRGLLLSSVMLADRLEPFPEGAGETPRRRRPYALGSAEVIPAEDAVFTADETLTVVFVVYNAATFVDGKPDVEVDYRVVDADSGRAIGATAPQLFDVDTLPEEFSANAGHQLTPVQSLPLAQFAPGTYRLEIEVHDHLGEARARAEVEFSVTR